MLLRSFIAAAAFVAASAQGSGEQVYSGICDGSAVALVGPDRFVTVSDEDPIIRTFAFTGGPAIWSLDLRKDLGLAKGGEGDLEAAARIGDTMYWIASLGTDGDGVEDRSRLQFFATKVAADGKLMVIGKDPALRGRKLFDALLADPQLAEFELAKGAKIAPKLPGGLNIEGLAAKPTGELFIGFRNPIIEPLGKKTALIVTLTNPAEFIAGGAPVFSKIDVDLGNRGVRDIVYRPTKADYLIIAGAIDETSNFALYEWDGKSRAARKLAVDFGTLNPEALTVLSDGRLLVLSDDGDIVARPGAKKCKKVSDAQKQFRAVILPSPD